MLSESPPVAVGAPLVDTAVAQPVRAPERPLGPELAVMLRVGTGVFL